MRWWRWILVGLATITVIHAASTNHLDHGLLLVDTCAILWAARIHVILEPRWTIDDEIETVRTWTL